MKYFFAILLSLSFNYSFGQTGTKQNLTFWHRSNSTISIFYNTNFTKYNFYENLGQISTKNQFSGYGLGFSKNFYEKNYKNFFSLGIKYFNTKANIKVSTDIEGIDYNNTSANYSLNYDRVVIPMYFGRKIKIFNKKQIYLEPYIGASLGVGYIAKLRTDVYLQKSNDDSDLVSIGYPNTLDLGPYHFYSSIDLGCRITPFNYPNFTIGVLATLDLTKSNKYQNEGDFINHTKGLQQDYKFNFDVKHINLMFSLNYTFGKKWATKIK